MSVGANSEQRRDQRASTAQQWTSGHDTIIIYHNQELSGQATSLWGSWCNAQAEMVPGDGVGCLERHTKQNKDPSKTIPFSIWAVFFAALYEATFLILHIQRAEITFFQHGEFIQINSRSSELLQYTKE